MVFGKKAAAGVFLSILLYSGNPADAGCPFIEPVATLTAKDSASDNHAFVSLAWVARSFSVTIRSADTNEMCVFDLDKFNAGNKNDRTGLFAFKPGKYRFAYQLRHKPGSHYSTAWSDSVVDLKAGAWHAVRFKEKSIDMSGKSGKRLIRAKTWRLELSPASKEVVIKHASGERPGIKTIVLVGIVLVTLLFGGIIVYAR